MTFHGSLLVRALLSSFVVPMSQWTLVTHAFVAPNTWRAPPEISTFDGACSRDLPALGSRSELLMTKGAESADKPTDESTEAKGSTEPTPPGYKPNIPPQLEKDLWESERRVMLFQKEVEMVRELLDQKEDELTEIRESFKDEKDSLLSKISDFTNLLAQRDEELNDRAEKEKETKARQAELESEIADLKVKFEQKKTEYEYEVQTVAEVRKRLGETQDAMEFEQMNFLKETKALQDKIDAERSNLSKLQEKLNESEALFNENKKELINRVTIEEKKLAKAQSSWAITQSQLEEEEKELREIIKQQELNLQQNRMELSSVKEGFSEERRALEEQVKKEQAKLDEAEQQLRKERERFEKSKKNLEIIISEEREGVLNLQSELLAEQDKFTNEKVALEIRIKQEQKQLAIVSEQLEKEREEYKKDRTRLQQQVDDNDRISKLKKKQMNERMEDIRKQLTELWENSKRDARAEEARLTQRYDKKLNEIKGRVSLLEGDLEKSKTANEELKNKMEEMEKQRQRIYYEKTAMESQYADMLAERNSEVTDLRVGLMKLQNAIDEKNSIIERYESSYREIGKLSLRLTRQRLKKQGSRLKRVFGQPKDNEKRE